MPSLKIPCTEIPYNQHWLSKNIMALPVAVYNWVILQDFLEVGETSGGHLDAVNEDVEGHDANRESNVE